MEVHDIVQETGSKTIPKKKKWKKAKWLSEETLHIAEERRKRKGKGEKERHTHLKAEFQRIAAAAKSLQSCPTLCDPIDNSPPGSTVPGILQARTLEWGAISFSNAWSEKWKWSRSVMSDSSQPHGLQPTRCLRPWDFPGKSTGVGCHCLLRNKG